MSVNQNIHNPYMQQQPHQQQLHMGPNPYGDGSGQMGNSMPGVLPVNPNISQLHQRQNIPPQNLPPQNMPPQNMSSQWGAGQTFQQSQRKSRDNASGYNHNTPSPQSHRGRDFNSTQINDYNNSSGQQSLQMGNHQINAQSPAMHNQMQQPHFSQQSHTGSIEPHGRNKITHQSSQQMHHQQPSPHYQHHINTSMQNNPSSHHGMGQQQPSQHHGTHSNQQQHHHHSQRSNNKGNNQPNNQTSLPNQKSNGYSPKNNGKPNEQKAGLITTNSSSSKTGEENSSKNSISKKAEPSLTDKSSTKDKTPMCLINEVAFFNKVPHQYELTNQKGPAHEKVFDVSLKLGTETYTGSGPSIKKAQHAAAAVALKETGYDNPPARRSSFRRPPMNRSGYRYDSLSSNPIIELNNLAAARGEATVYQTVDPNRSPCCPPPNFDFRGMYNQRYHYGYNRIFYVTLQVGGKEFYGTGHTQITARQNAAMKALHSYNNGGNVIRKENIKSDTNADKAGPGTNGSTNIEDLSGPWSELKSDVSKVHEIALRRNLNVTFEVVDEYGLAHERVFLTKCTVGNLSCTGEGSRKKQSKQESARLMLIELEKLDPIPVTAPKPRMGYGSYGSFGYNYKGQKKNKVIKKTQTEESSNTVHPVSRLIHIQQAKKAKEPVFTLVGDNPENGKSMNKTFTIQVEVGQLKATGNARNKKQAKKNAAQAMLVLLGYTGDGTEQSKPVAQSRESGSKRVTYADEETSSKSVSRQVVPGVLLMQHDMADVNTYGYNNITAFLNLHKTNAKLTPQVIATIAKELLDAGMSPTAEKINLSVDKSSLGGTVKSKLMYLVNLLGFTAKITEFPKCSKDKYLCLTTIHSTPPLISCGNGSSQSESHDQACLIALQTLCTLDSQSGQSEPSPVVTQQHK